MWGLMTLKKEELSVKYENVLSKFQEKLPSTMIFFSSIFHRKDRKYENEINDSTFLKSLFGIMPATGLHLEGMGTTRIQKEYGSYLLVEMDTICFISTYCI